MRIIIKANKMEGVGLKSYLPLHVPIALYHLLKIVAGYQDIISIDYYIQNDIVPLDKRGGGS